MKTDQLPVEIAEMVAMWVEAGICPDDLDLTDPKVLAALQAAHDFSESPEGEAVADAIFGPEKEEEMDEVVAVNLLNRMYGTPVEVPGSTCGLCGAHLPEGETFDHFTDNGCINKSGVR